MPNPRLLILACSARKRGECGLLPAHQRYDGSAFRVLHRWQREYPAAAQHLDVFILSAQFGLITSDTPIPDYDRRMTPTRAHDLRSEVQATLAAHLQQRHYTATFTNLGAAYGPALTIDPLIASRLGRLTLASGGIGIRLGLLKRWLHAD